MAGRSYNGFKADVWSLGIVLLEILCGVNKMERVMNWPRDGKLVATPERAREVDVVFDARNFESVKKAILADVSPQYLVREPVASEQLVDMITRKILQPAYQSRVSIEEIARDPWVSLQHAGTNACYRDLRISVSDMQNLSGNAGAGDAHSQARGGGGGGSGGGGSGGGHEQLPAGMGRKGPEPVSHAPQVSKFDS